MEPYLGEIRIFAGTFAPEGWQYCQGQMLSIAQYSALYQLIGTTYGGDGNTSFALPNLSSRVVVGQGPLPGGSNYVQGQALGTENVTLNANQAGGHTHPFSGSVAALTSGTAQASPTNNYFGNQGNGGYLNTQGGDAATLGTGAVSGQSSVAGGSQPHANVQPVLATSYIICMEGIYPSQS